MSAITPVAYVVTLNFPDGHQEILRVAGFDKSDIVRVLYAELERHGDDADKVELSIEEEN